MLENNGGRDRTRTRPISSQPVSGDCNSFHFITGCRPRCSLEQPVSAGCYQDVITDLLPDRAELRIPGAENCGRLARGFSDAGPWRRWPRAIPFANEVRLDPQRHGRRKTILADDIRAWFMRQNGLVPTGYNNGRQKCAVTPAQDRRRFDPAAQMIEFSFGRTMPSFCFQVPRTAPVYAAFCQGLPHPHLDEGLD
jgi:hypothetical protein